MATQNQRFPSRYLKGPDVGTKGKLLTIASVTTESMKDEKGQPKPVTTLTFKETDKKFSVNQTNWKLIAKFTGKPDDDDWVGEKVVIYYDESVTYMGKVTGGCKVRAPKKGAAPNTAPVAPQQVTEPVAPVESPAEEEEDDSDALDDEIPF